jgi:DNA-binding MurR/RpiR family transcriptional regulator
MTVAQSNPVLKGIVNQLGTLAPKGKILDRFIVQNPGKAVFTTTLELSEACGVSEAAAVCFTDLILTRRK